jgi:hypothetical protein
MTTRSNASHARRRGHGDCDIAVVHDIELHLGISSNTHEAPTLRGCGGNSAARSCAVEGWTSFSRSGGGGAVHWTGQNSEPTEHGVAAAAAGGMPVCYGGRLVSMGGGAQSCCVGRKGAELLACRERALGGRRALGGGVRALGAGEQGARNGCAGEGRCPWEGAASLEEWSSAAMVVTGGSACAAGDGWLDQRDSRRELGVRAEGSCRPGLAELDWVPALRSSGWSRREGAQGEEPWTAMELMHRAMGGRTPAGSACSRGTRRGGFCRGRPGRRSGWSLGRRPWGREEHLLTCCVEGGRVEGDAGSVRRLKEKRKMVVAARGREW